MTTDDIIIFYCISGQTSTIDDIVTILNKMIPRLLNT